MIDKLLKLKPDDIVYVSDERTLTKYKVVHPIEMVVDDVRDFFVKDRSKSYKIIGLKDNDDYITYLVLDTCDKQSEMGLYYPINEFPQANNRQDILNKDIDWLFKKPFNCDTCDLEFVDDISPGTIYSKKFPTIYGELDRIFCSVTEYATKEADIDEPDLLLMEIGGMDSEGNFLDCGGALHLWQGHKLNNNDIKILLN